ncbi:cytochrome P450 2F3-like isoform X1 [Python bivittatus]|uniref:Cytochrome P450 2F3-like isoform X1 n=1 Tax=Python bivittatus TaxID=176946 RepID=A0A9F5J6Y4_PYTBI|nr:cytochrome P450 2F3-like isoform X1 [Python bivittatus]XP_025031108.1 cytochrome P450 2F3-like isoform X1 [Python bivittatus]
MELVPLSPPPLLLLLLPPLCVFCIYFTLTWRKKGVKGPLPPGPTPFPILGNFLQLDRKNMVKSLMKHSRVSWQMSEVYGPVFTVYLGLQRVVVLCGYQAVKEALVDQAEEFSGRGQLPAFSKDFNQHGIVFANGDRWQQLRRFTLTTLRNFGMGKRSIEERIQEEAQCLVEELQKTAGTPFDPTFLLSRAVSNIICSIVFGNRFKYNNEKFLTLNKLITERFRIASSAEAALYNIFPEIMEKIPGAHHAGNKCSQRIISFIKERIQMQQVLLDPCAPQNYIDCFLAKMEQEKHNPDSEFCMENLVMATFNLFFAGTETISTTLRYSFLLLMKYPQVQEKLHEEIDRVIGPGRSPAAEDRRKMPYTEAVLHEVQRFSDILPMSLPHAVTRDTHFRGYVIPKGTYIYPLLSTVHYDSEHHASPEQFDPGRFLDSHGRFKRADAFMPFSAGKRLCLGEGLARMELFLFFTAILQAFTLTSPEPLGEVSIVPDASGVSRVPMRYQMLVLPRQS